MWLMVFSDINIGGRTDMYIIRKENLKTQRIIPEILQLVLWRFFAKMKRCSVWNSQHVPLSQILSSIFGTNSDEAFNEITVFARCLRGGDYSP
ncbi:hypothetical protein TNCV_184571 [Trichonephila clavipes]|nr:hypothetical protein TNCV_184571 [Trichonephila clavipes]